MISTEEILDYIRAGEKIEAVRLVKNSMGCSLREAKEYVDSLEKTCREERTYYLDRRWNMSAIDGMDGHEFEYFCAELLKKNGFHDVSVTPGTGDQGVDVLAVKDGIKYAVQCKNYASALGNTPVQEVAAGRQFYGCHVGVVLTNSTFTPGAIQLANATNVLLWDRLKLEELILKIGGIEKFDFDLEFDDFDDDEEYYDDIDDYEDNFTIDESNTPRKGMRIWSKICIGWSGLCFLIFAGGFIAGEKQIMTVGLGEGGFILVLGKMFEILSKTEKKNPYMIVMGKYVKKSTFVAICIIIAYIVFIISMGVTGGLGVSTS